MSYSAGAVLAISVQPDGREPQIQPKKITVEASPLSQWSIPVSTARSRSACMCCQAERTQEKVGQGRSWRGDRLKSANVASPAIVSEDSVLTR